MQINHELLESKDYVLIFFLFLVPSKVSRSELRINKLVNISLLLRV